jgi:hypothetical protein
MTKPPAGQKRPSKKEDLAQIRAVLQRETAKGASFDDAVAKAWDELPAAARRVTKEK